MFTKYLQSSFDANTGFAHWPCNSGRSASLCSWVFLLPHLSPPEILAGRGFPARRPQISSQRLRKAHLSRTSPKSALWPLPTFLGCPEGRLVLLNEVQNCIQRFLSACWSRWVQHFARDVSARGFGFGPHVFIVLTSSKQESS